MDGSNRVSNAKQRAVSGGSEKRQRRSVLERRQIVEETLAPGASVARVARTHEVNANRVHYWRSLYRRGLLGGTAAATAALVQEPVKLRRRDSQIVVQVQHPDGAIFFTGSAGSLGDARAA